MDVFWSKEAMHSLANIYDYIFENSPKNANLVFETLLALGNSLSDERFEYTKELVINTEVFQNGIIKLSMKENLIKLLL